MDKEYRIIAISGPSGVGKTTIYKEILKEYEDCISFSISATTRKIRAGEVDGKDYYFLSTEKFEELIASRSFVEWERVHNNYYGTLQSEIHRICSEGKHCLLDIDVKGGLKIKELFKDNSFLIFIAPPSIEELEKRLRNRGMNDEISLQRRLANAIEEMDQKSFYSIIIENEIIDDTIQDLKQIIKNNILNK